jgi:hypothetical protein
MLTKKPSAVLELRVAGHPLDLTFWHELRYFGKIVNKAYTFEMICQVRRQ